MWTSRPDTNRLARRLTLPAIAFAAALLPLNGAAQQSGGAGPVRTEAARGGFHFSIGMGGGSVSVTCPGCDTNFFDDRLSGVSGVIQIGGFVTPRLAIAGELMGWLKNDDPIYRRVASVGVTVLGYPSADGGFFVKGSLGGIRAIGENDLLLVQTDAFMATTGVGYDIPVGEQVRVTPYANYVRAFGAGTWVNGVSSDFIATPNVLQLGAALTVH